MPAVNPGTTNLVAWWSLNETSGTRNDSHGANHLTIVGGGTSYAVGLVGNAADFEQGTSDYLEIADNAALSMGTGQAFTICAWVKPETLTAANHDIVSKYETATNNREYRLIVNTATPTMFVDPTGNAAQSIAHGSTISTGAWSFLVGGWDSADSKIFIGLNAGALVRSAGTVTGAFNGVSPLALGNIGRAAHGLPFDGLIDEVCIYKRALSADEITWLYNSGAGRAYAELSAAKPTMMQHHHAMLANAR